MPPPANPRKRAAPGTSPAQPAPPQPPQPASSMAFSTASPQLTNDQFLRWGQVGDASMPADATLDASGNVYDMGSAGVDGSFQTPLDPQASQPATSTQLARRGVGQQLVARGARGLPGGPDDPWADLSDNMQLDLRGNEYENDEEELEQRAQIAKREALAKRKQIPPFVQKLSSFLDESRNTDLIRWSDEGDSFIVLDEDEFAKTLIPELFKHNNYASFVRQLNMYGFHKKVGLSDNSMRASERKNKSPSEYFNRYFRRGQPDLLWLINKPKSLKPSGANPAEEVQSPQLESGPAGRGGVKAGVKRAGPGATEGIGSGGEGAHGNAVHSDQALADVREQLQAIQQQQRVISGAINRLRKDQSQIYEQAVAFQTLHDRHESSINAILTFLATVYNRSLEGHGAQDFAKSFSNAIPQDAQGPRNVVDVGDLGGADVNAMARYRRPPLLLGAPPAGSDATSRVRVATESPLGPSPMPTPRAYGDSTFRPAQGQVSTVEDVSAPSPQVTMDGDAQDTPQQDILSMINSANASSKQNGQQTGQLDFPAALTHYQNANGNSPLTPKQRNDMLNMMARDTTSSDPSGSEGQSASNALTSPNPTPSFLDLAQLNDRNKELERLVRMQAEQNANMQNLANLIQPLSPSGPIPGLPEGGLFDPNQGLLETSSTSALDLDQIFNSGDYFNAGSGSGTNADGMNFDANNLDGEQFDFGDDMNDPTSSMFGLDGSNDKDGLSSNNLTLDPASSSGGGGRIIGQVTSSEDASPANTNTADDEGWSGMGIKREDDGEGEDGRGEGTDQGTGEQGEEQESEAVRGGIASPTKRRRKGARGD